MNSAAPSFVVSTDGGTFTVLIGDASHYGGGQHRFTDLAVGISARVVGPAPERSHGKHVAFPANVAAVDLAHSLQAFLRGRY
jgi:hypothetical protein